VRFVDSHLHLEEKGVAECLALATSCETLLVSCGVDHETSEEALELAASNPKVVKAFVGVHPSEASTEGDLRWLGPALERATGLGEAGLDPKYSATGPGSAQLRVLTAQLEAVQAARKPVQVHSRNAERECLDSLSGFAPPRVLMHWFQGEEYIQEVVERGYFVSFGPQLLYSKKLQRIASRCPRDQALTETDSPVAFEPLGGVGGPSLVATVAFKLAELWGGGFEDTRATLVENAVRFLGSSEKG
jgi:TatD DNase family protein